MDDHSSRQSPPGSASSLRVIPPIIKNEKDRNFLKRLTNYIEGELNSINSSDPYQRFIIHRSAFEQVIDYSTAYKPLLTAIKAEYDSCIESVRKKQQDAFYLNGKLKSITFQPSTMQNYWKRTEELEHKLGIVASDNDRLEKELLQLKALRQEQERQEKLSNDPPPRPLKRDSRNIPGLTLEQSTHLPTLMTELDKLEKQFKEISQSKTTKYTPTERSDRLKEQLSQKVLLRDQLTEQTNILKAKRQKLRVAVEAAQAYMKLQPPHQTIGEAVVNALNRSRSQHPSGHHTASQQSHGKQSLKHVTLSAGLTEDLSGRGVTPSTTFEDDDPSKEKEAELILEYIEKFSELLDVGKYEEAAVHAANSPKGILRTPETMNRFKDLHNTSHPHKGRSPLLAFCDALMSTVHAYGARPSERMSLDCVNCALDENRLDLITHWIAQDRLTITKELGDVLFNYSQCFPQSSKQCLILSQNVYTRLHMHKAATICMIKQSKVTQALNYAKKSDFSQEDYIDLLERCPTIQLAEAMYREHNKGFSDMMPLGLIVRTLMKTDLFDNGLHLLQDIHLQKQQNLPDMSPIHLAVLSDTNTSTEEWLDIVAKCQDSGYHETAIEVLAAVTVLNAMRGAKQQQDNTVRKRGILKFSSHPVMIQDANTDNEEDEESESDENDHQMNTGKLLSPRIKFGNNREFSTSDNSEPETEKRYKESYKNRRDKKKKKAKVPRFVDFDDSREDTLDTDGE